MRVSSPAAGGDGGERKGTRANKQANYTHVACSPGTFSKEFNVFVTASMTASSCLFVLRFSMLEGVMWRQ